MIVAERSEMFAECWLVPKKAPERAGSPCTSEKPQMLSSPLLSLIQGGQFHNMYQQKQWEESENEEEIFWIDWQKEQKEVKTVKEGREPSCAKCGRTYTYGERSHRRPVVE